MTATAAPAFLAATDALVTLYAYPNGALRGAASAALSAVAAESPAAAELLEPLVAHLTSADLAACEELFVTTFELNPVCALEVGWQMYGEQYARGAFLVKLQGLTREAGLPPPTELADHLPNVLRVVARVADPTAHKLATTFTLPALAKMTEALAAQAANPYRGLLAATTTLLENRFGAEVTRE